MLKVADEGVLVIVIHMGDDALLRYGIGRIGGFLGHTRCARMVAAEALRCEEIAATLARPRRLRGYTMRRLHVISLCGSEASSRQQ